MLKKGLGLSTAVGIAYVYLQSQLYPQDALFLLTSNNLALNSALLAAALTVLYISFTDKFKYWQTYMAATISAAILGAVGLLGGLYSGIENYFGGLIMPLDYLMFLLLGIVLGICSLSAKPATRRLSFSKLLGSLSLKPLVSAWLPRPPAAPPRSTAS